MLTEAAKRVPKEICHKTRIYLDYRTHSGSFPLVHIGSHAKNEETFKVLGHDSRNPYYDSGNSISDVVLPAAAVIDCAGSEEMGIFGVCMTSGVQMYDSSFMLDNCEFANGFLDPSRAISGYSFKIAVENCHFENMDQCINPNYHAQIHLEGNTKSSVRLGVEVSNHCSVSHAAGDGIIDGPGVFTAESSAGVWGPDHMEYDHGMEALVSNALALRGDSDGAVGTPNSGGTFIVDESVSPPELRFRFASGNIKTILTDN